MNENSASCGFGYGCGCYGLWYWIIIAAVVAFIVFIILRGLFSPCC